MKTCLKQCARCWMVWCMLDDGVRDPHHTRRDGCQLFYTIIQKKKIHTIIYIYYSNYKISQNLQPWSPWASVLHHYIYIIAIL